MKASYKLLILLAALGMFGMTSGALAQEIVVEWADSEGQVITNALRDAIALDTVRTEDRVYKLKRGGFYWIEDAIEYDGFHLRLVGETADEADPQEAFVCGANFDEDCGPAIIQRVRREDQSVTGKMIQNAGSGSHLTVQNVWLMGQDDGGALNSYQQVQLNASDSRYVFDNVIFDRNDWQFLGVTGSHPTLIVTNSKFRNIFGPAQQWEGMGAQFDAGADTVIFDNNSFHNMGFTIVKSEAAPMQYFRVNHNTFVNTGRNFTSGAIFKEAYITNNVFVNYSWHGEQPSEYDDPNRIDGYAGHFGISSMPSQFGTNLDRRIVLANNSFWRDPEFANLMPSDIREQPIVNDTTAGWFAAFDGMVMQDNLVNTRAEIVTYPDNIADMVANITELRAGSSEATRYFFDLGRDEECFVCNVWPTQEDFSYETADLLTAGTDGLPVGDLNWFESSKDDYEANKSAYVEAVEAIAGGRVELNVVGSNEADSGTITDGTVETVGGFKYFQMESSGSIEYNFDLAAAGTYHILLETQMAFGTKGQHLTIDGQRFKNVNFTGNGEFVFNADILGPDFTNKLITPDSIWVSDDANFAGPEVLTMDAGAHTFKIEPSWGFQRFGYFRLIDPVTTDTVVALGPADAIGTNVVPVCDESDFCPTNFTSVALDAGGSVAWDMSFPTDGQYVLRVFYNSESGASGSLKVNGTEVDGGLNFASGTPDLLTAQFSGTAGINTVTLESSTGGVNVDFVQLIEVIGGSTGIERDELPDGYALDQNYPNPFNGRTVIAFTMGEPGAVTLTVYDLMGRRVATLADGLMPSGTHQVSLDASTGSGLASGMYFYRLETPVGQRVRSMVLVK